MSAGLFGCAVPTRWTGSDALFGAFRFGTAPPGSDTPGPRAEIVGGGEQKAGSLLPVDTVRSAMNVDSPTSARVTSGDYR